MRETNWKKHLRIKNRKDWILFWIFTALVCYCLGHPYSYQVNTWLREKLGSPWLGEINEPQPYGRMIAAVVILAVIVEAVLFLCRKPLRTRLTALAAGVMVLLALVGAYWINCRLIVSVLWTEVPRGGTLYFTEGDQRKMVNLSPEDCQDILELVQNMTIMSEKEKKDAFMEWYREDASDAFIGADMVELRFPEKYGHDYMLNIRYKCGYVYFWRGHGHGQSDLVTLFEDNEVIRWMENAERRQPGT